MIPTILDRFYSKLSSLDFESNKCCYWTGGTRHDYGNFYLKETWYGTNITIPAHVFSFILFYKKEPVGEVHHKCETPRCCNPLHLEDLLQGEHRIAHRGEYCKAGHKYSEVGIRRNGQCRECGRLYARKYRKDNPGYKNYGRESR